MPFKQIECICNYLLRPDITQNLELVKTEKSWIINERRFELEQSLLTGKLYYKLAEKKSYVVPTQQPLQTKLICWTDRLGRNRPFNFIIEPNPRTLNHVRTNKRNSSRHIILTYRPRDLRYYLNGRPFYCANNDHYLIAC
jgi:hypothetical protein